MLLKVDPKNVLSGGNRNHRLAPYTIPEVVDTYFPQYGGLLHFFAVETCKFTITIEGRQFTKTRPSVHHSNIIHAYNEGAVIQIIAKSRKFLWLILIVNLA